MNNSVKKLINNDFEVEYKDNLRIALRYSDGTGFEFTFRSVKELIIGPPVWYIVQRNGKRESFRGPRIIALAETTARPDIPVFGDRIQVRAQIDEEAFDLIKKFNPSIKITQCQNQEKENKS